jgi:bacterial/archaeal transporter family-2 protein
LAIALNLYLYQNLLAMLKIFWMLPFVVGICTVMQGALNKRLATEWGLGWALLWNSLICAVLAGLLVAFNLYPGKINFVEMKWWHFLPGLFGFVIILLIPLSISKLGALNSFLILVCSQIIVSGAWDQIVEGISLSWTRLLGACLALLGAWLATK